MKLLQNKLDDTVLDVISVMLARNPQCKLKPEDVQVAMQLSCMQPLWNFDSVFLQTVTVCQRCSTKTLRFIQYWLRRQPCATISPPPVHAAIHCLSSAPSRTSQGCTQPFLPFVPTHPVCTCVDCLSNALNKILQMHCNGLYIILLASCSYQYCMCL